MVMRMVRYNILQIKNYVRARAGGRAGYSLVDEYGFVCMKPSPGDPNGGIG